MSFPFIYFNTSEYILYQACLLLHNAWALRIYERAGYIANKCSLNSCIYNKSTKINEIYI